MKIRKLELLIGLYMFCVLISNIMGAKTFPLFTIGTYTLNATVAIFVLPLVYMINDVITEVHGRRRARSVIMISLILTVLTTLFALLATALPPSTRFAPSEAAYEQVFGVSIRFAIASLLAFATAEFLDVKVFTALRDKYGAKALWLRTNVSNFISEFVDTIVFMLFAFWAVNESFGANFEFILSLTIPYWLLKCFMSIVETPLAYWGVRWLRREPKTEN
jgi:queuosine precursor transporter